MKNYAVLILFSMALSKGVMARTVLKEKKPLISQCKLKDGPVTIFVHGTIFPVISRMMQLQERMLGLIPYESCTGGIKRIATLLEAGDAEQYKKEAFYSFSWSGNLSFAARKTAAHELYKALCSHKGPKTIICHSHGCSVGINLACVAEELKADSLFCVDTLILLAPPVQIATALHVSSPFFKEVFSFYSSADLMQIADPQGFYDESKAASIDRNPPLLSKRTFPDSPNLVQARIVLNWQSPGHRMFVLPRFMSKLPTLLRSLKIAAQEGKRHVIVNIPLQNRDPHFVHKEQLAHSYIPRTVRSCRCSSHKVKIQG